jgi:hypothetical protein
LSIVYGALRLAWAFKGGGLGTAVLGILTIALGILLLVNPFAGAVVLPWIYGVFLTMWNCDTSLGNQDEVGITHLIRRLRTSGNLKSTDIPSPLSLPDPWRNLKTHAFKSPHFYIIEMS